MKAQRPTSPARKLQPFHRGSLAGVMVGLVVAVILTGGVSVGAMGGELFILVSYVVGAITAGVAWSWEFRGKQWAWSIGVLILGYSIASMVLTEQFWLALGALALMGPIIVVPSIYRLGQQLKRDRLQP